MQLLSDVMRYFGAPEPKNFDRIASEIAARTALREHFDVIRKWDDRQVRSITASLRGLSTTAVKKP